VRSVCLDDAGIRQTIAQVYREFGYVADPHTACGFAARRPGVPQVVLSTASPAKFPETVSEMIGVAARHPTLDALQAKPIVRHDLEASAGAIRDFVLEKSR
jgi:threonine synthase